MTTHRLHRKSKAAPAAVPAGGFSDLVLCYRIGCQLCGRTAAAEPGLQAPEASAAFAGKGWRRYRTGKRAIITLITVCRSCARHLGPQWEIDQPEAKQE